MYCKSSLPKLSLFSLKSALHLTIFSCLSLAKLLIFSLAAFDNFSHFCFKALSLALNLFSSLCFNKLQALTNRLRPSIFALHLPFSLCRPFLSKITRHLHFSASSLPSSALSTIFQKWTLVFLHLL